MAEIGKCWECRVGPGGRNGCTHVSSYQGIRPAGCLTFSQCFWNCGNRGNRVGIITNLDLDLSNLSQRGESRNFTIKGTSKAEFILEIKDNTTGYYYNFVTNVFQEEQANLEDSIGNSSYRGNIVFPVVTGSDDQYDIYLYAKPGTFHDIYKEVRFRDGSIDINSSTGSNSLMMKKVIYQYANAALTISKYSLNSTIEWNGSGHSDEIIYLAKEKAKNKVSFTVKSIVNTTSKAYTIARQPKVSDILSFQSITIGAAPELLPGESEHPTLDITAKTHGSTATSSSVTVTMADTIGDIGLVIGDRVRLTSSDGLDFSSTITVSAISGGGLASNQFTASSAISVSADTNLYFYHKRYQQWPINNIENIQAGMGVLGTSVNSPAFISDYSDEVTLFDGTNKKQVITKNSAPFKTTKNQTPTIVKGEITTQPGNIVFDSGQVLALGGTSPQVFQYGELGVLNLNGYTVKLTNLTMKLTPITTTTTSAVVGSTTVPVASVLGILPNTSGASGIGIDNSSAVPTVTARSATSGAGNLTLSAAQNLESGITLTFPNAGQIATITGDIEIIKAGTANKTIYFDLEKLLTIA